MASAAQSVRQILHGGLRRKPRHPKVAAPESEPDLAIVPAVFPLGDCSRAGSGMDPASRRQAFQDCVFHGSYLNMMNQSIANIAQVASPYAPGIAAVYEAALAEVLKAGPGSPATAATPRTYTLSDLDVTVSPRITIPVPSFELELFFDGAAPNGAAFPGGIELNVGSPSALGQDQPDVERTMYHEGFHWLSDEVTGHNLAVERGTAAGKRVRPELDAAFVRMFATEFRALAEPIWKDALAKVGRHSSSLSLPLETLLDLHWLQFQKETLSQIEEAVYLRLRQGEGFRERFDLPALPQDWLLEPTYWDPSVDLEPSELRDFLIANKDRTDRDLLPLVQKIQAEFLRQRPKPRRWSLWSL